MPKQIGLVRLPTTTDLSTKIYYLLLTYWPANLHSNNLPLEIQELYTKKEVSYGRHMALGANGSFFFSYKPKNANGTRVKLIGLPTDLDEWIFAKDADGGWKRSLEGLRVSLGPKNESWFATDGNSYRWCNLPEGLQKEIDANMNDDGCFEHRPRIVSLGVDGDYVWVTGTEGDPGEITWVTRGYQMVSDAFTSLRRNGNLELVHVRFLLLSPSFFPVSLRKCNLPGG